MVHGGLVYPADEDRRREVESGDLGGEVLGSLGADCAVEDLAV